MSAQTLTITLRALVEGLQQVTTMADALKKVKSEAADAPSGAGGFLAGVVPQAEAATAAYDKLAGAVKTAIGVFATFVAIKGIKELADYAARTETLGITLGVVAKNAGYSATEVSKYETELKALGITTQAAREGMTQMIQAGLPLGPQVAGSASNLKLLARAAQDLAVVTGENSSATFQRLITNIQQMDTMGLRFMGLTVDIQGAQERYATSIGVASSALTQQQKVLAVNNAVLQEASKLAGAYELSMETVGKKVQSLKRYQEELGDSMGQKLLPAYAKLVDGATEFLKRLDQIAQKTDASKEASSAFGDSIGKMVSALSEAGLAIAQFLSENAKLLQLIASDLVGIVTEVVNFGNSMLELAKDTGVANAALFLLSATVAAVRDTLELFGAMVKFAVGAVVSGFGAIALAVGTVVGAIPGLGKFGEELAKIGTGMLEAGSNAMQGAALTNAALSRNEGALGKFITGVEAAKVSLADFGKSSGVKDVAKEFELLASSAARTQLTTVDFGKASARAVEDLANLAKSGKFTAEEFDRIAASARQAGVDLPKGLQSGKEALQAVAEEAKRTQASVASIGSSGGFKDLEKQFQDLLRGMSTGALTTAQVSEGYAKARKALDEFTAAHPGAKAQIGDLNKLLGAVAGNITTEYEKALKDMGLSVSELATGMDEKTGAAMKALQGLASSARTTAEVLDGAFSKGIDMANNLAALAEYSKAIDAARESAERLRAQGDEAGAAAWLREAAQAAELAANKFELLFQAGLKTAKTEEEFRKLKEQVTSFGVATGASVDWVVTQIGRIDAAAAEASKRAAQSGLDEVFKKVGISAEEAAGRASKAVTNLISGLRDVATAVGRSSEEFKAAWKFDVSQAKTIADLQAFATEAKRAFDAGETSAKQYSAELNTVNARLGSVLEAQLKLATTPDDFKKLADQLRESGLSAEVVAAGLNRIAEAARSAADDTLKVAQNATAVSEQTTRVARAGLEVTRASMEVTKAHANTIAAELQYKRTGSELDRAAYENAKAQEAVAKAQLELARARAAEEKANLDVLIAKQRQLNAEKARERDPGNPELVAQAEAAKKVAEQTQVAAEQAKQLTNQTEQNVIKTQEQAAHTQEVVDGLKAASSEASNLAANAAEASEELDAAGRNAAEAADATAQEAAAHAQLMDQLAGMITYVVNGANTLKEVGYTLKEATEIQSQAASAMASNYGGMFDGLLDAMGRIMNATKEFQTQMKAATDFKASFDAAAASADRVAQGLSAATHYAGSLNLVSDNIRAVYEEVATKAWEIAKAAKDSADAFAGSAYSIHEELLRIQGKEDEIAIARYAQRRKELDLEWKMLEVKLKAAEITAKAGGLGIDEIISLQQARRDAENTYQQARRELDLLEEIELTKIKNDQAQKRRDAEQKIRDAEKAQRDAALQKAQQHSSSIKAGEGTATSVAGKVPGASYEGAGTRVSSTTNNTVTVNVDGSDLLSEDQIRRKVVPALNSIIGRGK